MRRGSGVSAKLEGQCVSDHFFPCNAIWLMFNFSNVGGTVAPSVPRPLTMRRVWNPNPTSPHHESALMVWLATRGDPAPISHRRVLLLVISLCIGACGRSVIGRRTPAARAALPPSRPPRTLTPTQKWSVTASAAWSPEATTAPNTTSARFDDHVLASKSRNITRSWCNQRFPQ